MCKLNLLVLHQHLPEALSVVTVQLLCICHRETFRETCIKSIPLTLVIAAISSCHPTCFKCRITNKCYTALQSIHPEHKTRDSHITRQCNAPRDTQKQHSIPEIDQPVNVCSLVCWMVKADAVFNTKATNCQQQLTFFTILGRQRGPQITDKWIMHQPA